MCRVISVANIKGGVAKTTNAVSGDCSYAFVLWGI